MLVKAVFNSNNTFLQEVVLPNQCQQADGFAVCVCSTFSYSVSQNAAANEFWQGNQATADKTINIQWIFV